MADADKESPQPEKSLAKIDPHEDDLTLKELQELSKQLDMRSRERSKSLSQSRSPSPVSVSKNFDDREEEPEIRALREMLKPMAAKNKTIREKIGGASTPKEVPEDVLDLMNVSKEQAKKSGIEVAKNSATKEHDL